MNQYTQMRCPKCQQVFGSQTDMQIYMHHVKDCHRGVKKEQNKQQFVYEKVPEDNTHTKYRWEKKPKLKLTYNILTLPKNDVKKKPFQQKEYWFRSNLETRRISWTQGADWLKISKENILMGSLAEIEKINMNKEVKVELIGQKVNDAGGLLRQWIHMIIKEIFDFNTGIFIFANTDDTMYRLKWDNEIDQYFSARLLYLLGVVIGKAIFERIPVNCFLDRPLLRQLCNGQIKLEDIYGYDTQLYKNWKYILDTPDIEQQNLETYFVTYKNNGGVLQEIELLEGHKDIKVCNENKQLYISLCIDVHTKMHIQRSLKEIVRGINTVFDSTLLQVFEPYELEMILYGVPFIDIHDWFENTEYKEPYNRNHQIIKWFWKVMDDFDQEQLGKILHFCTASTRTPIHGFSRLESNRGNYSKFLIVPSEYSKRNPFPKGHTCFNRLELPLYPDFQTLKMYVTAISKNQLDGVFGLD